MAVLYTNNAASLLSASITNAATSFSVTSGQGALFPALTGSDYFYITLVDNAGNYEIVKVTGRSTDTFTITRGQDGTSARAFSVGDKVELRIVRAMLDDLKGERLPLTGGTLTGTDVVLTIRDDAASNDGSWRGRIVSKNVTSGVASFLGNYQGKAGVYAHSAALDAWADLYVNTSNGSGGGAVRMTTSVFMGGNQALHAGNYTDYAAPASHTHSYLPLSGGTLTNNLKIQPVSESWAEGLTFLMPTTTTWGGIRWQRQRANADGNWYIGYTALDSSDDLVFGAGNGGTQVDNILRLTKAGVVTNNGNQILHAGNSQNYKSRSLNSVRTSNVDFNSLNTAVDTFTAGTNYIPNGGAYNQPADGDHHYLSWGGIEGASVWGAQIDINFYDDRMWFRRQSGSSWQGWRNVLHDGNYSSYALPLSGGTMTGTLQFNAITNSLIAQHDGNSTDWRGRIISRNSSIDRATFIGNYNGKSGIFSHTNALDGWAPLYLNTLGSNGGYNVYLPHNATYTMDGGNNTYPILNSGNYTDYFRYNTWDDWLRDKNDDQQFKLYGNSRTVIFRTDGNTNDHGGGAYAYIWYYGGSSDPDRRMILNTNGNLWTNSYGWLHDAFAPMSHNHDGRYVFRNNTVNGNIDSDWGESFTTFDPVPSGTPPLSSPNIRTINLGNDYNRRTQLAFNYDSDRAFFRRRTEGGWGSWREFLHSGNYTSYTLPLTGGTISGDLIVGGRNIKIFEANSFIEFYVGGDANTYYPVRFDVYEWDHWGRWSISRHYSDTAPWDPVGTGVHHGGLTFTWEWTGDGAWGGNDHSFRVVQFSEQYTTQVGGMALSVNGMIVWLRGGNAYYRFHGPGGVNNGATPYYSTYTASNGATYSPRSYDSGAVSSEISWRFPVRYNGEFYEYNNRVLNASNYSSYALPAGGGTVSGNLGLGVSPDIRLSVNGDAHISSYLYMGGTAGSKNSWGSRDYTSGSSRYVNANYFEVNNYGYGSSWSFAVDGSSSRYNGNVILHAGNYTNYLGDYTYGNYRVIADYSSANTWYIRSNGRFTWARAHDWSQSYDLNLGNGTTNGNDGWAKLGQVTSNTANGTWFGTRFVQYAGGSETDGYVRAGRYYLGNDSYYVHMVDWGLRNTTPYGWIQFGPANSSWAHIYSSGLDFYFNANLYTNGWIQIHSSNVGNYALDVNGGTMYGNATFQRSTDSAIDFYHSATPSGTSNRVIAGSSFVARNNAGTYQTMAVRRVRAITSSTSSSYGIVVDEAYVSNALNAYTNLLQDQWSFYSSYSGSLVKQFAVTGTEIGPGAAGVDNTMSAGGSTRRYSVVYAVTGTINTSDVNEKEQIQDLDAAERRVAVAVKGLIKKFKWKDAVAKKGDAARIHIGVIAQEVEAAFVAEGLDPERYALFCKDVWWEKMVPNENYGREDAPNEPETILETFQSEVEGGTRKERKGIRYDQLLAFVISAI